MMGHLCTGEIFIPMEDFYEFVSRYAPASPGNMEFGLPTIDGNHDLIVQFAINTECLPSDQVDPPEFLVHRKKVAR